MSILKDKKNQLPNERQGIATMELLIALPLIIVAFVTLMFLAQASHVRNSVYQEAYLQQMGRHSTPIPSNDIAMKSGATNRGSIGGSSSCQAINTTLQKSQAQDERAIKHFFPATEAWNVSAFGELNMLPNFFSEDLSKTSEFKIAIFQGTGDPENRPSHFVSPSKDDVKALGISLAATSMGEVLGIDLDQINEFQELLTSLHSIAKVADVSIHDVKKQAERAGKEALEELQKLIEEEIKEKAKSPWQDWDKIRRLQNQIKMIRSALKQFGLAGEKFEEILNDS